MKKYEEPKMKFHKLKTSGILAGSIQGNQPTTFSDPQSDDDNPATQGFQTTSAW